MIHSFMRLTTDVDEGGEFVGFTWCDDCEDEY